MENGISITDNVSKDSKLPIHVANITRALLTSNMNKKILVAIPTVYNDVILWLN